MATGLNKHSHEQGLIQRGWDFVVKQGLIQRGWDFVVKYGAGIAVIIYGLWTVYTWNAARIDQANSQRNQQAAAIAADKDRQKENFEIAIRDLQRPFLEK